MPNVSSNPSRRRPAPLPRWVAWLLVSGVTIAVVLAGYAGFVWAVTARYYQVTPTFEEFVRETPVDQQYAESWLPDGGLLAEGEAFSTAPPLDTLVEEGGAVFGLRLERADEVLLVARVRIDELVDSEASTEVGARVFLTSVRTRPGMRAVVQVGLVTPSEHPDASLREIAIDALLLAGPGEDVFRVVGYEELPQPLTSPALGDHLSRLISGRVLSEGSPPQEGYVHHLRARVHRPQLGSHDAGWLPKAPKESTTLWPSFLQTHTNAPMYSFAYELEMGRSSDLDGQPLSFGSRSVTYTWNDVVW